MALSEVVQGHFDGETFAINVASLGLSSAAVKAGLQGISWVVDLGRARRGGALIRGGANLARLARLGGWFYTAAETAVVLYLGDELAQAVHRYRDTEAARTALAEATLDLRAALGDPALSPEAFAERLEAFQRTHADWRNFLYRELLEDDARYQGRLERVARAAKLLADEQAALAARLERLPALRRRAVAAHGSVEAYLEAQAAEGAAEVERDLQAAMQSYERARAAHLRGVYEGGRRDGAYLPDDAFQGPVARLRGLARGASLNRLQAYDDEAQALQAARRRIADPSRAAAVDQALARVAEARRRDAALFGAEQAADGLIERVRPLGGD